MGRIRWMPRIDDWHERYLDDYMAGKLCPDPLGKWFTFVVRASEIAQEAADGRRVFGWEEGGRHYKTSALLVDVDAICVRHRKNEAYNPLKFPYECRCDPRIEVPYDGHDYDAVLVAWSLWCEGRYAEGRLVEERFELGTRHRPRRTYARYAFDHDGQTYVTDTVTLWRQTSAPRRMPVIPHDPEQPGGIFAGFGSDCQQQAVPAAEFAATLDGDRPHVKRFCYRCYPKALETRNTGEDAG